MWLRRCIGLRWFPLQEIAIPANPPPAEWGDLEIKSTSKQSVLGEAATNIKKYFAHAHNYLTVLVRFFGRNSVSIKRKSYTIVQCHEFEA